jgi:hypothetical protein
MRSALAGLEGGVHVGKSGEFGGYFERVYTGVLDRGVRTRRWAGNERAGAVGFSEECRFFQGSRAAMGDERTEADRGELVVPTQARDRACVVTRLLDWRRGMAGGGVGETGKPSVVMRGCCER